MRTIVPGIRCSYLCAFFPSIMLLAGAGLPAQSSARQPHIGTIHPAGLQRGTTTRIIIGGQFLRDPRGVHVTGPGLTARVIRYFRPSFNMPREQRQLLRRRLAEIRRGAARSTPPSKPARARRPENAEAGRKKKAGSDGKRGKDPADASRTPAEPAVKLPEHPLLFELDRRTPREAAHIERMLFHPLRRRQQNRQLAESVLIEVTATADASLGDRELRLETRTGLTNPMTLQVGCVSEFQELEPNDVSSRDIRPAALRLPPVDLPVLFNGQILPGDVDRFRFRARAGQKLVIRAQARHLVPYLADAVPGWFQATVALFDAEGHELAFGDDNRFDPDPVLFFEVPRPGIYSVEIRDALYRGREDFVYRLQVSEQPYVVGLYPLGARESVTASSRLLGWNLPDGTLLLDTRPGSRRVRELVVERQGLPSNPVAFAIGSLPEAREAEPNDDYKSAQAVACPQVINGMIGRPGDVDVFSLTAGSELVVETTARLLGSPLDSIIRISDRAGRVLAWNDDHLQEEGWLHTDESGLMTHQADSYLKVRLPRGGQWFVSIADTRDHGGETYAYRLRLSRPRPDFALRAMPSGLLMRAGQAAPVVVRVVRKDGFDGPVLLALEGAPPGFALQGARIPAGCDSITVTLTAPSRRLETRVPIRLEGRARVRGHMVRRPVIPADDCMQAFLYRHVVPAREFLVAVRGAGPRLPHLAIKGPVPVRLTRGHTTQVTIRAPMRRGLKGVRFQLINPPPGVRLAGAECFRRVIRLRLAVDGKSAQQGLATNLIVEAWRMSRPRGPKGRTRRVTLGALPAIPIRIG